MEKTAPAPRKSRPNREWPAGVRRFSYRKNFEIRSGNNHDNVQIAFNVLPPDKKSFLEYPKGTIRHFEVYPIPITNSRSMR